MDSLFQAAETLAPSGMKPVAEAMRKPMQELMPEPASLPRLRSEITSDQHFLLLFVMGTYFGPNIKAERPKKSVFQRITEGLPPYTSEHLEPSLLKTVEAERVYYYVLRHADPSVKVKLPVLYRFFRGHLSFLEQDLANDRRQFPDLFPLNLHWQTRFRDRYKVIENVVFINDPDISYIKQEDAERFKRLSGLEALMLDREAARLYGSNQVIEGHEVKVSESNGKLPLRRSSRNTRKRRRESDRLTTHPQPSAQVPLREHPLRSFPPQESHFLFFPPEKKPEQLERVGPAVLFLPLHPTVEEWDNIVAAAKSGIALTGTVASRQAGPLIGLVDIGACEDAYLFRISLPGVKKDEREFSCEVESDGRVLIRGITTTGEKRVVKDSQVFEMRTQYLCPSGPFTVSFQLPGPVEPREFSGNFGSDGILEGVVMKERSGADTVSNFAY